MEAGTFTEAQRETVEELSDGYQAHVRMVLRGAPDPEIKDAGMCWQPRETHTEKP